MLEAIAAEPYAVPAVAEVVIGIEASHASPLAAAFAERALAEGAAVVQSDAVEDAPAGSARLPAFGATAPGPGSTLLSGAGHGAQQHVALAAAGAQVIVAFPALDDAPVGFAVCPLIAVAGSSPLHAALGDDFDLGPDATVEDLWAKLLAVLAGSPTAPKREARASSRSSASR